MTNKLTTRKGEEAWMILWSFDGFLWFTTEVTTNGRKYALERLEYWNKRNKEALHELRKCTITYQIPNKKNRKTV